MRRPSKQALQSLVDQNNRLGQSVALIQKFVNAFDHEFWKLVAERIRKRIDGVKAVREDMEKLAEMPEVNLKMLLAQEETLKSILSMPEDTQALLEQRLSEQGKLNEKINAIRADLKDNEG